MEKPPKYKLLFPKDLDYLNQSYEKLQQRLNAIDYELENGLTDPGPAPRFRPAGPEGYDISMRERRSQFLQKTRERFVKTGKSTIEKQIASLGEKSQKEILFRFDYETSRNGFKTYTKENLKEVQHVDKQDEQSMDYMAATHFAKYHELEKSVASEKENIDAWSDRYVKLLDSYNDREDLDLSLEINDPELDLDY